MIEPPTAYRLTTTDGCAVTVSTASPLNPRIPARLARLDVMIVPGVDADRIGALILQQIADEHGVAVVVEGETDHHGTTIFHPAKHNALP